MTQTKIEDISSAQSALWERGELSWLLYDYQIPIYNDLKLAIAGQHLKYVLNCARRFGKTTILILLAMEHALQHTDHHIRFASSTSKEIDKAIHPIIQLLLRTCPKHLKPKKNAEQNTYVFQTGSTLHYSGTDNQRADNLRGQNSHLNLVDEAGKIDNLKYLIDSVLIPRSEEHTSELQSH